MSSNQDQAKLIAERVARRLADDAQGAERKPLNANGAQPTIENRRARIVNFVSAAAPPRTRSSIGSPQIARAAGPAVPPENSETFFYPQVVQSPWLAPFARTEAGDSTSASNNLQFTIRNSQPASHPSEERFGVDEAAVSELVEFFEAEKQCTVDPSGQPCDHCAMCSSRGF